MAIPAHLPHKSPVPRLHTPTSGRRHPALHAGDPNPAPSDPKPQPPPFARTYLPQDDAVLRCALVCENALVRPRAAVEPGAIVSFGVVIGQGHRVAANKRVSLCQQINRGVRERVLSTP